MNIQFSDKISGLQPSAIREIFKHMADPTVIAFAGGNPDPESFPAVEFEKIASDLFLKNSAVSLQYSITEGYTPLREAIVKRNSEKFNIGKDFDNTIVVSGGTQGLDLTCKVLCNEGDVVICEKPSFIGALNAFRSYNTRLVGIDMEDDGMNIAQLENALKTEKKVKFIYTIPNFHNPMGITTSLEKRKAIYELAIKYNVIILEDNPYGELRFRGESIPAIKSMDTQGIVAYVGSFSKVLSAGMRVGFITAHADLIAKIVVAKQVTDLHTNIFFQMLVYEYMKTYDFDKHIAKIREIYKNKSSKMLECIDKHFPDSVKTTRPDGGLFLWCDLPNNIDGLAFSKNLLQNKIAVVPGSAFLCDEGASSSSIRLNYSMPSLEKIEIGIEILGNAIKKQI